MRVDKFALLVAAALWSSSCSNAKTADADDLRSDLKQCVSFAAEEKLFIDRVLEERIPRNFARGHLEYLHEEIHRTVQQAHQSVPRKDIAPQFERYLVQLDRLEGSLDGLQSRFTDKSVLMEAQREVQQIQIELRLTQGEL